MKAYKRSLRQWLQLIGLTLYTALMYLLMKITGKIRA